MLPAAYFCQQAAPMSSYKFTQRAVASPDAPLKPLVRKRARSGGETWVWVTRRPDSRAKKPCTGGSQQPACAHTEHQNTHREKWYTSELKVHRLVLHRTTLGVDTVMVWPEYVAGKGFNETGAYTSSGSHLDHQRKPVFIRDEKIKWLDFGKTPNPENLEAHPGFCR